jgi:hypothetical protein
MNKEKKQLQQGGGCDKCNKKKPIWNTSGKINNPPASSLPTAAVATTVVLKEEEEMDLKERDLEMAADNSSCEIVLLEDKIDKNFFYCNFGVILVVLSVVSMTNLMILNQLARCPY